MTNRTEALDNPETLFRFSCDTQTGLGNRDKTDLMMVNIISCTLISARGK